MQTKNFYTKYRNFFTAINNPSLKLAEAINQKLFSEISALI